ncbi:hypothetical protein BBO99_00006472 [Phytophthora kernoviae]|uniref:U6 snRNA-associated Sm-like protein LSm4 n=2 Tax=Phytophthora kernoviae TaxID=325452 RepID=A0A3R7JEC8_9STRA|nr:hypothetical protein G195_007501 [Phytophthora kernoviae 00238/432]KAG2522369.1 hypothetical protein JM18_006184 [Phytophthora kernoviae]KAG2527833.1 hypothetical protein JM16_003004 [Phytophthora kernoviae]RLN43975.1 hypothetical protein BBI17_003353 [Phytophthora kernoviae]RLN77789.1 hypothetical protein BBO99_00006472 [Phytophthora kernoviae]
MLPLSLLKTAQGHPMLVELKNGDTYNGHLVNCDTWMNVNLREVICTSKDGDRFWKMPECYIRGNTIKYIRVPNEILDMVNEEDFSKRGECLLLANHGTVKRTVAVAVELVAALVAEEVVVVEAGEAMALVAVVGVVTVDVAVVVDEVAAVVVDAVAANTS